MGHCRRNELGRIVSRREGEVSDNSGRERGEMITAGRKGSGARCPCHSPASCDCRQSPMLLVALSDHNAHGCTRRPLAAAHIACTFLLSSSFPLYLNHRLCLGLRRPNCISLSLLLLIFTARNCSDIIAGSNLSRTLILVMTCHIRLKDCSVVLRLHPSNSMTVP